MSFFSTPCKGNTPSSYPRNLVLSVASAHCCRMRMVLPPTALISVSCTVAIGPDHALGVWRVPPARSPGPYSNVLTIRFEPHNSGEVFTLNRTEANGRSTTSSVLLYFDGRGRTSVLDRRRNAQSGRSVALTVPVPVSGRQSTNNFNRAKKGRTFWRSRTWNGYASRFGL